MPVPACMAIDWFAVVAKLQLSAPLFTVTPSANLMPLVMVRFPLVVKLVPPSATPSKVPVPIMFKASALLLNTVPLLIVPLSEASRPVPMSSMLPVLSIVPVRLALPPVRV